MSTDTVLPKDPRFEHSKVFQLVHLDFFEDKVTVVCTMLPTTECFINQIKLTDIIKKISHFETVNWWSDTNKDGFNPSWILLVPDTSFSWMKDTQSAYANQFQYIFTHTVIGVYGIDADEAGTYVLVELTKTQQLNLTQ